MDDGTLCLGGRYLMLWEIIPYVLERGTSYYGAGILSSGGMYLKLWDGALYSNGWYIYVIRMAPSFLVGGTSCYGE